MTKINVALLGDLAGGQSALTDVQNAVVRQAEILRQANAKTIGIYQDIFGIWVKHRVDHLQAGLDAAHRLASSANFADGVQIYQEWVADTLQRLQEEASALPDHLSTLGAHGATVLESVVEPLTAALDKKNETALAPGQPLERKRAA